MLQQRGRSMRLDRTILMEVKTFPRAVGSAMGYGLVGRGIGVQFPVGAQVFSPPRLHRLWGPPTQRVPGAFSLGVKRPGREADYSPPTSAEFKNGGAIPPIPHTLSCIGALHLP
jgi:hypothetical protein